MTRLRAPASRPKGWAAVAGGPGEKLRVRGGVDAPAPPGGIGLSLSGGGARGLAHIGALKALESLEVPIVAISGASMGGVIGALFAAGHRAGEIEELALRIGRPRALLQLVDLTMPRRSLVATGDLRALLSHYLDPDLTFADLPLRLALTATDLAAGCQVSLMEGNVLQAVLATSAFPGVFPPVEIDGRSLVDGGVLNNLPVDLLAALGAGPTLAIDVSPGTGSDDLEEGHSHLPPLAQIVYRSAMLMSHALTESRLAAAPPDLLIKPVLPQGVGVFDGFTRAEEIIIAGEQAMQAQLAALEELVERCRPTEADDSKCEAFEASASIGT